MPEWTSLGVCFDDPDQFDLDWDYHPRVDQHTLRLCSNCCQLPAVDRFPDADDDSQVLLCRICEFKRNRRIQAAKRSLDVCY
jgi:hypothetical protein